MMRYWRNKSRQQSPCWEANSWTGNHKIPLTLWNPEVHYHLRSHSWARWIESTTSHPISSRSVLIVSAHLSSIFQVVSYLQFILPKHGPRRSWYDHPSTFAESVPAVRKGARGPTTLHIFCVFLGSIIICRLYNVTISNQAQLTLQLTVFPAWCKYF